MLHGVAALGLAEADRGRQRIARRRRSRPRSRGRCRAAGRPRRRRGSAHDRGQATGPRGSFSIPASKSPPLAMATPLEPEGPCAQVGALGPRRLLAREPHQLDAPPPAAAALQVAAADEPLGGGLAGEAVCGVGVGRDEARGQRRGRGRPEARRSSRGCARRRPALCRRPRCCARSRPPAVPAPLRRAPRRGWRTRA